MNALAESHFKIAAAIALLALILTGVLVAFALHRARNEAAAGLAAARNWGYQLQHIDPVSLAATELDALVIDHSRDGSASGRLSVEEVAALKTKPDGSRRVVLSYLSIGEAEEYRAYWRDHWREAPPAWLGAENPRWAGNYAVDYADPDWQSLIYGQDSALLDVIIDQGFDGVYLDRVDAYYGQQDAGRRAMIDFVAGLAEYGRSKAPGLLIVQQNGEDLLEDAAHREVIDGFAKEDLYFGVQGMGVPNPVAMVRASLGLIRHLSRTGKPVFVVEYDLDPAQREHALAAAQSAGFTIAFAARPLDVVPESPVGGP